MKLKKIVLIATLLFLVLQLVEGQDQPYFLKKYPDTLNKKRLGYVIGGQTFIYVSTISILYQSWYKDYPQSGFHWLNDNSEWLQMDKIGHATTSAHLGMFGYEMYRWAGVERKKAIWVGGSVGFIYLTVIEILDGFSAQWGASMGDFVANAAGAGLFIGQQLGWKEERLKLKWSYHATEFAKYRADQLGKSGLERVLKDYNGQTYWLSGNIKSFLPKSSKFPYWLNIAVGYGAEGMLGANSNPSEIGGVPLPEYQRYRQYFLSFDVDMSRIKTRSHFLKFLLVGLNFVKIPFPTVEFNKVDNVKFHWLYF